MNDVDEAWVVQALAIGDRRGVAQQAVIVALDVFRRGGLQHVVMTRAAGTPGQGKIEMVTGRPRDRRASVVGELELNKDRDRIEAVAHHKFVIVGIGRFGGFVGNELGGESAFDPDG